MEKRIRDALKDLSESLKRIESLCAWRDLKKSEAKPDVPPSFQLHDDTKKEIKAEIGYFFKLSLDIRNAIYTLPESKREKFLIKSVVSG